MDNASLLFNPDQHDGDGDGVSDPIDTDDDNDGISDFTDPCPFDALNSCVGDRDSDGIPDGIDGCANVPGNGGGDKDGDGKPDGCDQDLDGDGVPNHEDNCPWTYNPDQADADTNGIGDVCQCPAETTGGTCPITLAEQFVYGSDLDGRVATVFRDTVRDVSDHSVVDSIFTRRLRQKEYELNDHLGNVRVRMSDLKRTSTPGSAPYTVDERGYQEYYPFGMLEPNRGATLQGLTPRFGYNGKEMDNDVNNRNGAAGQNGGGNSYDYGARMYNPRLGRWMSEDALQSKYPDLSPYTFADNTPITALDPDGNVVIFINGQNWNGEGGSRTYWRKFVGRRMQDIILDRRSDYVLAWDVQAMNRIGDHKARYYDGSLGGGGNTIGNFVGLNGLPVFYSSNNFSYVDRWNAGYAQAQEDAKDIFSRLEPGETIKIVAHSYGAAYSMGFEAGLLKAAVKWNEENKDNPGNLIDVNNLVEVNINFAPMQAENLKGDYGPVAPWKTLQVVHDDDMVTAGATIPGILRLPDHSNKGGHSIWSFDPNRIPQSSHNGHGHAVSRYIFEEKRDNNTDPKLLDDQLIQRGPNGGTP